MLLILLNEYSELSWVTIFKSFDVNFLSQKSLVFSIWAVFLLYVRAFLLPFVICSCWLVRFMVSNYQADYPMLNNTLSERSICMLLLVPKLMSAFSRKFFLASILFGIISPELITYIKVLRPKANILALYDCLLWELSILTFLISLEVKKLSHKLSSFSIWGIFELHERTLLLHFTYRWSWLGVIVTKYQKIWTHCSVCLLFCVRILMSVFPLKIFVSAFNLGQFWPDLYNCYSNDSLFYVPVSSRNTHWWRF